MTSGFQEIPGPDDDGKSRDETLKNIMVFMSSKGDLYLGMDYGLALQWTQDLRAGTY